MNGARLIPSVCSADSPPGEHLLFREFANDSGCIGWVVLHSLDLAKHVAKVQGEADFVVLIPGKGIVVVEVKSHTSIRRTDQGWWLGTSVTPDLRGPFKQASQAMHSIRAYLNREGCNTDGIPFVSAVAFPSVRFTGSSPEWHPWQVLDVQALRARSISENLLRVIHGAQDHFKTCGLRWASSSETYNIESVVALLRPRFEFLCNPAGILKTLDAELLRCTVQQFRFLDNAAENDRLLVSGLAGTGKTTLAVECLRRERAKNPDSRVALFCFNRFLGEKLRHDCSTIVKGSRCGSIHQWLVELLDIQPTKKEAADPDFWSRRLPEMVLDVLTSAGETSGLLDLLILDEAQDLFKDAYLDIFDLLLKGGLADGRWVFFGDFERQHIYQEGSITPQEFRRLRAPRGAGSFRLDVNCRNTAEISQSLTLVVGLNPSYSETLRGDSHVDPEVVLYDSNETQARLVEDALDGLLGAGFKPEDIVILSPYAEDVVVAALQNLPRWKSRVAQFPGSSGKIRFSTIHAFKGLEANAIILTSVDNLGGESRIDLLYIGMSRALHRLHIFAHRSMRTHLGKGLS